MMRNSGLREFRVAFNMGYGQVFQPEHLERAEGPRRAAQYALRRYFGQQMIQDRFSALISTACTTYGRRTYEIYTMADGATYEKGYTVIVDDVALTDPAS